MGSVIPTTPLSDKPNKMTEEYFLKTAKSGDIIVWSGIAGTSRVIRIFAPGEYSHVGIIFRGYLNEHEKKINPAVGDIARVFHATPDFGVNNADGNTTKDSMCVMLNDLDVLYAQDCSDKVATICVLKHDDPERIKHVNDVMAKFILRHVGDRFTGALIPCVGTDIFKKTHDPENHDEEHHETWICSQLVPAILQMAGVLKSAGDLFHSKGVWWPSSLASGDEDILDHLIDGFSYGAETRVIPSHQLAEVADGKWIVRDVM